MRHISFNSTCARVGGARYSHSNGQRGCFAYSSCCMKNPIEPNLTVSCSVLFWEDLSGPMAFVLDKRAHLVAGLVHSHGTVVRPLSTTLTIQLFRTVIPSPPALGLFSFLVCCTLPSFAPFSSSHHRISQQREHLAPQGARIASLSSSVCSIRIPTSCVWAQTREQIYTAHAESQA